jgi:hypothetical protein
VLLALLLRISNDSAERDAERVAAGQMTDVIGRPA